MEGGKKTLPKKFKKPGYCKVRHIMDFNDIFIETQSNPVIRASTWSDYKHHNTAKILVLITPNGAFNFISEAWGGRTSDVHVTRESEFYNILEPYDAVMPISLIGNVDNIIIVCAALCNLYKPLCK